MALRKVAFVLASACAYMVSVQHSSSPCVTACDSVRWTASSPSFHAPEIIDPYSRHFDVLPSIRPVALQQFLRVDKSDATILPLVPLTRSLPRARLQDNPSRIFKQIRSLLVSFSINFDILVFLILFARRVIGATRPWLAAPAELVKAVLLHAAMRLRPELDHHPLAWFDDAVASILLTVVIDYLGGALMAALVSYQERRKLSSLVPSPSSSREPSSSFDVGTGSRPQVRDSAHFCSLGERSSQSGHPIVPSGEPIIQYERLVSPSLHPRRRRSRPTPCILLYLLAPAASVAPRSLPL
ncbi:hypothetical protein C8F04DRAFT_720409 [Mycena alexandri]|uniref:Uncharacterized protein n=1 Tax=Mycena alexandri TaxID=1745969 RepID=A0AAD6XB82_9AGAR|nr:hypothetical protein C8F04DRAFT_720409 [Mycena alexandri]